MYIIAQDSYMKNKKKTRNVVIQNLKHHMKKIFI